MREALQRGLLAVEGVTSVVHDDRERWMATGPPIGKARVIAAAQVVDRLADRARAYLGYL
jgi:hypothetical protein